MLSDLVLVIGPDGSRSGAFEHQDLFLGRGRHGDVPIELRLDFEEDLDNAPAIQTAGLVERRLGLSAKLLETGKERLPTRSFEQSRRGRHAVFAENLVV